MKSTTSCWKESITKKLGDQFSHVSSRTEWEVLQCPKTSQNMHMMLLTCRRYYRRWSCSFIWRRCFISCNEMCMHEAFWANSKKCSWHRTLSVSHVCQNFMRKNDHQQASSATGQNDLKTISDCGFISFQVSRYSNWNWVAGGITTRWW